MRFGSLFAGIGGFDLGLERAGMKVRWQVEIDPFCNEILEKHWPHVKRFGDIRSVGKENLEAVELICGGFPCQPFSKAGKRRGKSDDRNLWPEMFRVVEELRPSWVIAENVPKIRDIYLDEILSDLEGIDYSTGTIDLPAVAFGAWHLRHRIYIVAHSNGKGLAEWKEGDEHDIVLPTEYGGLGSKWQDIWISESSLDRVADGVPRRVDRIKALGNAVVPQVATFIGWHIMKVEEQKNG